MSLRELLERSAAFGTPALAGSPEQYAVYRQRSIAFVNARNARMVQLGLSGDHPLGTPACTVCPQAAEAANE